MSLCVDASQKTKICKTKLGSARKMVENDFLVFQRTKNGSLLEWKMEQSAIENSTANADTKVEIKVL